jgi:hypothetical protein
VESGSTVAEQQSADPGLLGESRVRPEDPQILAMVETHDHEVRVIGLDKHERYIGGGIDLAQPIGHVFDVGGVGQRNLRGRPVVVGPNHSGSEVGHGPPGQSRNRRQSNIGQVSERVRR